MFVKKFVDLGANISATCQAVGINRATYYRWLKIESFSAKIELAELEPVDNVESALYKAALDGNITAQIFFLKKKKPGVYGDYAGAPKGDDGEIKYTAAEVRNFMLRRSGGE